jgi:large subunit ribosomal protein L10
MPKTAGAVRRKVKTPAEGRTKLTQNFVNLSVCGQRGFSDKRKNAVTANPILNKTGGKPFMAKVELKQPVVDEIKAMLDGAVGAVVVDYRGLTVEQDTKLRKQLREAGVSYKVYKNTLIKRAAEGTEFAALDPHLEGPTALAVSKDDATAPARILAEFAKTAPKLELKASVVEGTYYDQAGTQVIATIPSREVLLGKLLGSIQSPITNLARVLNQIAEKNGGAAEA